MPKRRRTLAWQAPTPEQATITADIEREISTHQASIISSLGAEPIAVYQFLTREYKKGAVDKNHLFQFVYRSYYRLDNAGLTDDFKALYFRQLEACRLGGQVDLRAIALEQRPCKTRRDLEAVQFSFITKLAATVSDDYPIYDGEVGSVLGFPPPYSLPTWDERLERYLEFYAWLRALYARLLSGAVIPSAITALNAHYSVALPDMKALDFLFWQAGKLEIVAVP
ncbi:MAG: hypothetical protein ACYCV6_03990 [Steroidobacteraceae bacterium]